MAPPPSCGRMPAPTRQAGGGGSGVFSMQEEKEEEEEECTLYAVGVAVVAVVALPQCGRMPAPTRHSISNIE